MKLKLKKKSEIPKRKFLRATKTGVKKLLQKPVAVHKLASAKSVKARKQKDSSKLSVLTLTATAKALGKYYQTIWRWIRDKQLPAPILKDEHGRPVYHIDEVKTFVKLIGDHENKLKYYRGDHDVTRKKIKKSISSVRKELGLIL